MSAEPLARVVNMAEFRVITGLSRHLVLRKVELGMPVRQKPKSRGEDYLFDLADCLRWELEQAKAPKVVIEDGEVIDFNEQRARLTKEQADKLARERREDERELVRRAPLAAGLAVQDQVMKDRLLMVPVTGAAEALAAGQKAGAPGVAAVYERHITRALSDLASAEMVARGAP